LGISIDCYAAEVKDVHGFKADLFVKELSEEKAKGYKSDIIITVSVGAKIVGMILFYTL
jgi:hypothetical protein